MKEPWITLGHPCFVVDVWEVENDEERRIAWGQGYVPLVHLRTMAEAMTEAMRPGMNAWDEAVGDV